MISLRDLPSKSSDKIQSQICSITKLKISLLSCVAGKILGVVNGWEIEVKASYIFCKKGTSAHSVIDIPLVLALWFSRSTICPMYLRIGFRVKNIDRVNFLTHSISNIAVILFKGGEVRKRTYVLRKDPVPLGAYKQWLPFLCVVLTLQLLLFQCLLPGWECSSFGSLFQLVLSKSTSAC